MILFSSIEISAELSDTAEQLQNILRQRSKGSYPVKENLHVTAHYFGTVTPETAVEIQRILKEYPIPQTELCFDHLLRFDGQKGDHIVYAAAENETLNAWRNALCEAFAQAGIYYDKQTFKPHITLVRGKEGHIETDDIRVPAVRFIPGNPVLLESMQIKGKRIYRPLNTGKETNTE